MADLQGKDGQVVIVTINYVIRENNNNGTDDVIIQALQ